MSQLHTRKADAEEAQMIKNRFSAYTVTLVVLSVAIPSIAAASASYEYATLEFFLLLPISVVVVGLSLSYVSLFKDNKQLNVCDTGKTVVTLKRSGFFLSNKPYIKTEASGNRKIYIHKNDLWNKDLEDGRVVRVVYAVHTAMCLKLEVTQETAA